VKAIRQTRPILTPWIGDCQALKSTCIFMLGRFSIFCLFPQFPSCKVHGFRLAFINFMITDYINNMRGSHREPACSGPVSQIHTVHEVQSQDNNFGICQRPHTPVVGTNKSFAVSRFFMLNQNPLYPNLEHVSATGLVIVLRTNLQTCRLLHPIRLIAPKSLSP
jgi:hypothetical protein